MKLSDDDREKIETLAKEAARRQYEKRHPHAPRSAAWAYALRAWRSPEFIQAAADILAFGRAIDEAAAAPLN